MWAEQARAKGLTFTLELGDCPRGIHRRQRRGVRQMVYNLLSNAVKFTSAGSITLMRAAWATGCASRSPTPASASRPTSMTKSSNRSNRPMAARRASSAAPGWASRSSRTSRPRWAAAYGRQRGRGGGDLHRRPAVRRGRVARSRGRAVPTGGLADRRQEPDRARDAEGRAGAARWQRRLCRFAARMRQAALAGGGVAISDRRSDRHARARPIRSARSARLAAANRRRPIAVLWANPADADRAALTGGRRCSNHCEAYCRSGAGVGALFVA